MGKLTTVMGPVNSGKTTKILELMNEVPEGRVSLFLSSELGYIYDRVVERPHTLFKSINSRKELFDVLGTVSHCDVFIDFIPGMVPHFDTNYLKHIADTSDLNITIIIQTVRGDSRNLLVRTVE